MAAILIRSLSTLLATVTWSLAAGGLDKREMNIISASPETKIATILNDGGNVYPSRKLDSHQAAKQNESTLAEEISIEKQSPFAQQQQLPNRPNVGTSFPMGRFAEALSPSMTSSSSGHLYSEFDKPRNEPISQLANNDLDISSTMFVSDKNEYLPQISTSVFPSILSSSASLLDSYAASAINSTTTTFFPQFNSTALSLVASSNLSHNNEVGINATDPFAFTTESRIMGLPIGIQVSRMHLFS